MAAKTTAKKKTTASKGGKTTTTKVTKVTAKKGGVASKIPAGIISERNPEDHKVSGKYTFFYVLFAITTIIFAAVSVWLFVFSSELLAKYESIQACARNHTTCEVRYMGDDADGPAVPVKEDIVEE